MRIVKISDLSDEDKRKLDQNQRQDVQIQEKNKADLTKKYNDILSKYGEYDTNKHSTTIGRLSKAYNNNSDVQTSLQNYYKNNSKFYITDQKNQTLALEQAKEKTINAQRINEIKNSVSQYNQDKQNEMQNLLNNFPSKITNEVGVDANRNHNINQRDSKSNVIAPINTSFAQKIKDFAKEKEIIQEPAKGNVLQNIGGSIADAGMNFVKGVLDVPENLSDLYLHGIALGKDIKNGDIQNVSNELLNAKPQGSYSTISQRNLPKSEQSKNNNTEADTYNSIHGRRDFSADTLRDFASNENYYNLMGLQDIENKVNNYSYLGNSTDEVFRSIGYTAGMAVAGAPLSETVGLSSSGNIPINLGKTHLEMPILSLLGGSASSLNETYQSDKSNGTKTGLMQTWIKAISGGLTEGFTEGMFGMYGIGGSSIEDKAQEIIKNKIAKGAGQTLANLGVSALGEASEEFVSYALNYMNNHSLDTVFGTNNADEWSWEDVGRSMASAFASTLISQGATQTIQSIANKFNSNDVYNNAIKLTEQQLGRNLSTAEKNEIKVQIEDLQRQVNNNFESKLEKNNGFSEQINNAPVSQEKQKQIIQNKLNTEIQQATQNKTSKGKVSLGKVSENITQKVKALLGINVENRTHVLSDNDIRHMLNEHGDPIKESKRGQIAITTDDISKIPDIISSYDDIIKGNLNKNEETIRYIKNFEDGTTYMVEVVPENSGTLNVKTMWKKTTTLTNNQQIPSSTPKATDSLNSSTTSTIISQNNPNMQEKQVIIPTDNKIVQNGFSEQSNSILNNKDVPMLNYQYEKSDNVKINNLRQDANKYFNNSEKAKNYVKMLEQIINDKNVDIRLDANLKTPDGKIANGSYSDGVITINPNSTKAGEFIAVHELTHAIGTDSMRNIIETYRKSNTEFNTAMENLLQNYNSTELTDEALSDVSAQLFGNQEFINNVSQNNPNIFKRIYNEIKYLWHQFRGYKNQNQFIDDLYYKWSQAYNNSSKLNETSNYSIVGRNGMKNAIKQDSKYQVIKEAYKEAKKLSKNNIDNEEIRQNTGWFQDKNGDWKFEISDKDLQLKQENLQENTEYKLKNLIEHKTLFDMYPKLKNYTVTFSDSMPSDVKGVFHSKSQNIEINSQKINTEKKIKSTLLHEVQHIIQNTERFERGTSKKYGEARYYNSLGEIEAKDTQIRYEQEQKGLLNRKKVAPESSKTNPVHPGNPNYSTLYNSNIDKKKKSIYDWTNRGENEYEIENITNEGKNNKVWNNRILEESENNSGSFSLSNDKWQNYLEQNYKSEGTKTNLAEIKGIAPIAQNKTQKAPIIEPKPNNTLKTTYRTSEQIANDRKISDLEAIKEESSKVNTPTINEANKTANQLENNVSPNVESITSPTIDLVNKRRSKEKVSLKEIKDTLAQKFVNKGHYIDKLAKETGNKNLTYLYDRTMNAFNEAQISIGDRQVITNEKGTNVEAVGKSIIDIFSEADKANLSSEFDDYLLNKHNVSRYAHEKGVFGKEISATDSQNIVNSYEKQHPEFIKWSKDVSNYNDNNLKDLVRNGLVSNETYNKLREMYSDYVPTFRDITDNMIQYQDDSVGGNTLKKATQSNKSILSIKESMAEQTLAIKKAIRVNELGVELYKTLGNDSKVHESVSGIEFDPVAIQSLAGDVVSRAKDGTNTFMIFQDGVMTEFKISDELYSAFTKDTIQNKINNSEIAKTVLTPVSKLSNIHRELLTTYSIGFAFNNPIKDIQDAVFNTKYSSLEFIKNYPKALYSIATDGEWYKNYKYNGGTANTYFDYEKGILPNKNIKFIDIIKKVNFILEQGPRLTEFITTREHGGTINEALYNSADLTTNFKRGGDVTKVVNKYGADFLNASVQGLDKFYRNLSGQNGWKGYANLLVKATVWQVAPAILNGLLLGGDEDYDDLPEYTKDNYFLFKIGDGKFFRIPKGRVSSVVGGIARRTLETIQGKEVDWNSLVDTTINQMAPNNPLKDNIVAPIVQASANKSWYGGEIVSSRLQKLPVAEQSDESTDKLSKFLGEKLNISPKKINYVLDQYSGGIGDVILPMLTPQAENNILEDKFTTDATMKNKHVSEYYSLLEDSEKNKNSENATDVDKLKYMYLSGSSKELGELYQKKRDIQNSNLSDKEKKSQVRDVQKKINSIVEDKLENVDSIQKNGDTATIGNEKYYKYKGEWKNVSDEESEKIKGISLNTYANYQNKVAELSKEMKNENKSITQKDKIKILANSNYSNNEKDKIYSQIINADDDTYKILNKLDNSKNIINQYLDYLQADLKADREDDGTEKGKAISGSKKQKVYDYINSIDSKNMSYIQKLYLAGINTTLSSTDKKKLFNLINENSSFSQNEKLEAIDKLQGFTVYKNGKVTW